MGLWAALHHFGLCTLQSPGPPTRQYVWASGSLCSMLHGPLGLAFCVWALHPGASLLPTYVWELWVASCHSTWASGPCIGAYKFLPLHPGASLRLTWASERLRATCVWAFGWLHGCLAPGYLGLWETCSCYMALGPCPVGGFICLASYAENAWPAPSLILRIQPWVLAAGQRVDQPYGHDATSDG